MQSEMEGNVSVRHEKNGQKSCEGIPHFGKEHEKKRQHAWQNKRIFVTLSKQDERNKSH